MCPLTSLKEDQLYQNICSICRESTIRLLQHAGLLLLDMYLPLNMTSNKTKLWLVPLHVSQMASFWLSGRSLDQHHGIDSQEMCEIIELI